MATTMAQALAQQIRAHALMAGNFLQLAGAGTENDRSGEVLGSPEASLTVRGNIGDIVCMNHYSYLSALASKALPSECSPDLQAECPTDYPGFSAFLAPRETMTAEEASQKIRLVNKAVAAAGEGLTDEELEVPVQTVFGEMPLRQLLFTMVTHGGMHMGQAWGILKGAGHTQSGFEALFF